MEPAASPLVSAEWLVARLGAPATAAAIRPVDVRWYLDGRSGRGAYEAGHIPGAVHLDIDRDLSAGRGAGRPGRHPLPEAGAFAETLRRAGIDGATTVVVYDDEGGALAARLWWLMTRYFRHPARVVVLDGGIQAWVAAGGALEGGAVSVAPAASAVELTAHREGVVADRQAVQAVSEQGGRALLDARALPRYRGDLEPVDPRAGHIPGATSAPFVGNLSAPQGRFLGPEALAARYAALGVTAGGAAPLVYCGSGVTACHDLLALTMAGVEGVLYEGSWSDWSGDPTLPARTGEQP